jgi:NDP-sugar pyrophosphorylase family protein
MISVITEHIKRFADEFPELVELVPWEIPSILGAYIRQRITTLGNDYSTSNEIAIHKSAIVEGPVTLKGPVIIGPHCFVAANAYLRGGVILSEKVSVGPGCEIKTTIILRGSALAHFNFIGDSVVGSNVNFEAGSVVANHFNERDDKHIQVRIGDRVIDTGCIKFGALIGDRCKIGANAVLSPGTMLFPNTIVKRLELVQQI